MVCTHVITQQKTTLNQIYLVIHGSLTKIVPLTDQQISIANVTFTLTMNWLLKLPGIILCMRPANEGWRYNVTSSLIGRAHTQNVSWLLSKFSKFVNFPNSGIIIYL